MNEKQSIYMYLYMHIPKDCIYMYMYMHVYNTCKMFMQMNEKQSVYICMYVYAHTVLKVTSAELQYTCMSMHVHVHVNERCRRKKERSKQGQTNKAKQPSTPKVVTFPKATPHSRQTALAAELYAKAAQLNLTSHSTPDEQGYCQLSMKEKAGVMNPPKTPNTKTEYTCIDANERDTRKK